MKHRNGFVSNSSSSSFVFYKHSTEKMTYEDVEELIVSSLNDEYYYNELYNDEIRRSHMYKSLMEFVNKHRDKLNEGYVFDILNIEDNYAIAYLEFMREHLDLDGVYYRFA